MTICRSKSLGQLLLGERTFDDPYDRNLSISTEQLLSGVENTVHPSDNMDFDLQLDERIFDTKKASSDTNLRVTQPQKPEVMTRKHSDPHPIGTRPSLNQQHTPSLGSSLASDLGEELSDTSSTLKSVRFDLDDSGVSSDHPSPRHQLTRRHSAPDTREQSPRQHKLVTEATDDTVDEGLGSDYRLELPSDNGLPSNSQSDASGNTNLPIKRRVSQMKERFQQEVKGQSTNPESRQRTRPISRRISETTKQLMESKSETVAPVTTTTPRKLVGLDRAVGIPMVTTDEYPEEPVFDTEFELFEQSRKSGLALPYFGGPLLSQPLWQQPPPPPDSDDDDDDDVMIAPISATGGISNVSPLHRGVFGGRFIQLGLMEGHEMFPRHTPSRTPSRKSSASRLTAIPEESPQGSTIYIT